MLDIGVGFFIETRTQSTARILHPAKILGINNGSFTAEIEESGVSLVEGAAFQIYFDVKQKFVKQAASVEAVDDTEPALTVEFITVGEPVSAESRQVFRVSTVMSNLTATLGSAVDCKLLNISALGLALLTTVHHDIGSTLTASVCHDGKTYSGTVCVQSIRVMDKDQIRYGLHCVDGRGSSENLEAGLRKLTVTVQRQQLRRLASVE